MFNKLVELVRHMFFFGQTSFYQFKIHLFLQNLILYLFCLLYRMFFELILFLLNLNHHFFQGQVEKFELFRLFIFVKNLYFYSSISS